jgi:hypothetical protein
MQQSKLLRLLRALQPREQKSLLDLVRSPYFNRQEMLLNLCQYLLQHLDAPDRLDREQVYAAIFPGETYDDARMNHLNSALLKLTERFCALENLEQHPFLLRYHTMDFLAERGLDKHVQYLYEQETRQREQNKARGAAFFLETFQLEKYQANRANLNAARQFNDHVQYATDALDRLYLTEKLRLTCYMLTSQMVIATPYNLQLVDEVVRFVETHAVHDDVPVIRAFYCVFCLLTREEASADFQTLKTLLKERAADMAPEERAELYQYAINYCNLQILKARQGADREALDLYIDGVSSGILLENGTLSPWHYKNMIKLGLRLQRFEWTEIFIRENTALLEKTVREDAYHFNLAELYYYTGRFDLAMQHLNKVEFTDLHYNLGAKVLLAKIYYETDAEEALDSLLHAFRVYLRRNRLIAEELRRPYLLFIGMLDKLLKGQARSLAQLRAKIDNSPMMVEKKWLLERMSP